jgi:hypothetical protein
MLNSPLSSGGQKSKSNWGFVQWALLGAGLGAICALIIVILFSVFGPRIFTLSGSALFWLYFLLLSVWILPVGLVIALCGMIGGLIVDKFLHSSKNHIGAKIGGFMAGFSLLVVLLVLFFNFWSDPVCDKLITGTEFSTEADAPTLGGRMHPSVIFSNGPTYSLFNVFFEGFIYFSVGDTVIQELYKCKNGRVTVYSLGSYHHPEGEQDNGQYNPVTDAFEWNGEKYTRGYKK